jgi:hypothetical protein
MFSTGVPFLGGTAAGGVKLTAHLQLVQRSWKRGLSPGTVLSYELRQLHILYLYQPHSGFTTFILNVM